MHHYRNNSNKSHCAGEKSVYINILLIAFMNIDIVIATHLEVIDYASFIREASEHMTLTVLLILSSSKHLTDIMRMLMLLFSLRNF